MYTTVNSIIVKFSLMCCSFEICILLGENARKKLQKSGFNYEISIAILVWYRVKSPCQYVVPYRYGDSCICMRILRVCIDIIWQFNSYGSLLFVHLWIEYCRMCQLNYFFQILYVHHRISLEIKLYTWYLLCLMKIIVLSYRTGNIFCTQHILQRYPSWVEA